MVCLHHVEVAMETICGNLTSNDTTSISCSYTKVFEGMESSSEEHRYINKPA